MAVTRNRLTRNFSVTPNAIIKDLRVKHTAFRVYMYLLSKEDGWQVYNADVATQIGISEDTVTSSWSNLLETGWITRERCINKAGQYTGGYEYVLHECPVIATQNTPENTETGKTPDSDKTDSGKNPDQEKPPTLIKTDKVINTKKVKDKSFTKNNPNLQIEDFEQFNEFIPEEQAKIREWVAFRTKHYRCKKTSHALTVLLNDLLKVKAHPIIQDEERGSGTVVNTINYFMSEVTWQNINLDTFVALVEKMRKERKIMESSND